MKEKGSVSLSMSVPWARLVAVLRKANEKGREPILYTRNLGKIERLLTDGDKVKPQQIPARESCTWLRFLHY
jgi:hypothetical protein